MRYWKSFSKTPPELADWTSSQEREIVLLDHHLTDIVARRLAMRTGTKFSDELSKRLSMALESLTMAPVLEPSYDGSLHLEDPDAEKYLKPLREAGVIPEGSTILSDALPDPGWPGIQVDPDSLFRAVKEQDKIIPYFDPDELRLAEAQVLAQTSRSPISFHPGSKLPPIMDRSTPNRRVQKGRKKQRTTKRRNALEPGTSRPNMSSAGPSAIAGHVRTSTTDHSHREVSPFDSGGSSMATIGETSLSTKRRASSTPPDTPSPKRPRTRGFYRQEEARGKKPWRPTPSPPEPDTVMCSSDVYQMEIDCAITDGSSQFGDDEDGDDEAEYDDISAEFLVPYNDIPGDEVGIY
ncbi:hypothetical protein FQN51_004963 [Onygenales sp. PD_10]|nr:hypothetical protein FQN51_004963 [Onygenales sp. PD_10]